MSTLSRMAVAVLFAAAANTCAFAVDLKTPDAQAAQTKAEKNYQQSKAQINGQAQAAKEDCSQLQGEQESACKARANADKDAAKANAKAKLDKEASDAKALKKQGYP